MDSNSKSIGRMLLRLLAVLALLGCPGIGAAAGTWSVIALPQKAGGEALGQVRSPSALAVGGVGNLYVADLSQGIQKRDAQGNWSTIALAGDALGQVDALAVDTAGKPYVAGYHYDSATGTYPSRIQKRDAQGSWSVIATDGSALGQVSSPSGLAVDAADNLYVADTGNDRVQEYMPGP
jgi:sugar lactone lactonase YvrE